MIRLSALILCLTIAAAGVAQAKKAPRLPAPPTNAEAHQAIDAAMVETLQVFDTVALTVEPTCPLVSDTRVCRGTLGARKVRFKVWITVRGDFLVSAQFI